MHNGGAFDAEVLEERSGFVSILIDGKGAKNIFANESGGHRWQRRPPTEKRGRVHTSTVTVAILDENVRDYSVDMSDIEYTLTRGSGPGGQHRNKVESCVIATHKPTGISVKIDARNQHRNKTLATSILLDRVSELEYKKSSRERDSSRKQQVGSGMRGDKRRTYRSQDDSVVDHVTGNSWKLSQWMKGNW